MLSLAALVFVTMSAAPPQQETAQAVYARVAPSVLLVVAQGPDGKVIAQGSGFVIEGSLIVTNAHVVRGGTPAVMTGVATIPCALIRLDEKNDLAVLRPSATMSVTPLKAANPNTPIGTRVFAIGNPQGLERTITEGIYSGPRQLDGALLLQISAPISEGSSGGPVVDSAGLVIGVAVGSLQRGQNLNFAVPVDTLITLLAQPEMGAARPLAAPPQPSVPVPPPVPAPVPAPAPAPVASPSAGPDAYLREFDAVFNQRKAIVFSDETRQRWRELRARERELLAAAVNAAGTDEQLLAVHGAAINEHEDIALDVAKMALQRSPAPKVWHYLGIAWDALAFSDYSDEPAKTKLLQEAKDAILKALPMQGTSATWLLAGRIHAELREWGSAKSAFNLANTIGPHPDDKPAIMRGLWRSHSGLNENAEADRWWNEFAKTGFATDRDLDDRANHIGSIGRMSEAAVIFSRLASTPNQMTGKPAYSLWYSATWAHWKAVEDKAALLAAAETVRAAPDTPDARHVAAMAMTIAASIQVESGDLKGAMESATFAIGASASLSSAYTQLARVHLASQRVADAEREIRKAISLGAEKDAEAYYVLGQVLGTKQDWAQAAEAFARAAAIDPASATAAHNAGMAYKNAGRGADAIRWYEEALRRNPNMKERDQIRATIAQLRGRG